MKIVVVIQARMTSQRLPGKVMHLVRGRPMLEYLVERLRHCSQVDDIILATSRDISDDPVAEFAIELDVKCFRGSLEDVASRLLGAAECLGADALVRVSGDSPLIDSLLIDRMVSIFRKADNPDIVTNVATRTFPKGQSVEVISTAALRSRLESGMTALEKEHVTIGFYQQPISARIINIEYDDQMGDMQLSVDTEEDMTRFSELLGVLGEPYWAHSLDRIINETLRLGKRIR